MKIQVRRMTPDDEPAWDYFVQNSGWAQISHTPAWCRLLESLTDGSGHHLVACDDAGDICGILPGILMQGPYGNILNSLPFFGCNGGVMCRELNAAIYKELLQGWQKLARDTRCVASTIISSPFTQDRRLYEAFCQYDMLDERIGQITALPVGENPAERLLSAYSGVRRRNIRKALKSGVSVKQDNSGEAFEFCIRTHRENMESIGGTAKPNQFFRELKDRFTAGTDYRLYLGILDEQPVSALLLMYHGRIVEYFTPATTPHTRNLAPQSLVIHRAMSEAAMLGYERWNWGGTWVTQDGVYNFKKKWAAQDIRYRYYVKLHEGGSDLLDRTPGQLLQGYPYGYVLPFQCLAGNQKKVPQA